MPATDRDFHTHSTYSDGTLSPAELVRAAHAAGVRTLSLTDHDITDGLPEAEKTALGLGVRIIPGIELSATMTYENGKEAELHILGYFIRPEDETLQKTLAAFREGRRTRVEKMIARLAEIGIRLDFSKMAEGPDGKALGRPHIARALVEKGHASSVQDAFNKYLKDGGAAYVPKPNMPPEECIRLIGGAGGLSVVAHPVYGAPKQRQGWEKLVEAGLDGIEAYHAQHTPAQAKSYKKLADELGLLVTGGSDFHSFDSAAKVSLGGVHLPDGILEALLQKKQKRDQL